MRYLLDANVLISLGTASHVFHLRAQRWIRSLDQNDDEVASCAITELAFVRIMSQSQSAAMTVAEARRLLADMRSRCPVRFDLVPDGHGADKLPSWAATAKQTTDGHLAELAKANGAVLATLDKKIPRAFVIPE